MKAATQVRVRPSGVKALNLDGCGAMLAGARIVSVIGLAFLVVVARRPESLATPEFYADDSFFYVASLRLGLLSLVAPYSGYLALIEHVGALPEGMVPPAQAPLVGYLAMTFATALVAGFLASSRMSDLVPSAIGRASLALLFVALPAVDQFFGSLSNVQWVTSVYLVAMLVATSPTSRRGRLADATGLLAAGLTGPVGLLLLPLYAWRAWRDPRWRWGFAALFGASVFQVGIMTFVATRPYPAAPTDVGLLPEVMMYRDLVVPIGGVQVLGAGGPSLVVGLLVAVALVLGLMRMPRQWLGGALYAALAVPLAGIAATAHPTAQLLDPEVAQRYFFLTGVIAAGLVVAALTRRQWLAVPIAIILAVGVIGDFRMAPLPLAGWAQHASCIGGSTPCRVRVLPDPAFDVLWPGS